MAPYPMTAYAMILYVIILHVTEAAIVISTHSADGSIAIAALLAIIPNPTILALTMFGSAALGLVVLIKDRWLPPLTTMLFLVPQQTLLMTTAIAAWVAVWNGAYADGALRSHAFMTADQLPRGMFSLLHITSIYAVIRFHRNRR